MDPWHNRCLIDYCQHVIYHLLPRTCGAPFLGEGEHYWSVIDDSEIEIMKALWEQEDYPRIPAPRRVLGTGWWENEWWWRLAHNTAAAFERLKELAAECDCLQLGRLDRGVLLVLALQLKPWKCINLHHKSYPLAVAALQDFCARRPELTGRLGQLTVGRNPANSDWCVRRAVTILHHPEDHPLEHLFPNQHIIKYDGAYVL